LVKKPPNSGPTLCRGIDFQRHPHLHLTTCLVGAGEIDKAKAAFVTGQRLGPDYFRNRLEGTSVYARPEDRTRSITFLRIAAGLEDPSAAESLR
jgi:hypothetical protein